MPAVAVPAVLLKALVKLVPTPLAVVVVVLPHGFPVLRRAVLAAPAVSYCTVNWRLYVSIQSIGF
jgi:hypothetical protein